VEVDRHFVALSESCPNTMTSTLPHRATDIYPHH